MRISDWSSDVCSSDLQGKAAGRVGFEPDVGFEPPVARYFVGKLLGFVGKRGDIQAGGIARRRQRTGRRLQVALGIRTRRQYVVVAVQRSEEHTSELQSLMRISYAVFCLKKKKQQ